MIHLRVLGRDPPLPSLLPVLCQIPEQKGGSIRQEKEGEKYGWDGSR